MACSPGAGARGSEPGAGCFDRGFWTGSGQAKIQNPKPKIGCAGAAADGLGRSDGVDRRCGDAAAAGRGTKLSEVAEHTRHGAGAARGRGAIGFAVFRGGDVVGDHTVTFAGAGERIELTHRASDRMAFARGAVEAARWLVGRPPGLYSMQDVLATRAINL